MSEKLKSDEWDEAYRMGAEAMRAACVGAVQSIRSCPECSIDEALVALREVQP